MNVRPYCSTSDWQLNRVQDGRRLVDPTNGWGREAEPKGGADGGSDSVRYRPIRILLPRFPNRCLYSLHPGWIGVHSSMSFYKIPPPLLSRTSDALFPPLIDFFDFTLSLSHFQIASRDDARFWMCRPCLCINNNRESNTIRAQDLKWRPMPNHGVAV